MEDKEKHFASLRRVARDSKNNANSYQTHSMVSFYRGQENAANWAINRIEKSDAAIAKCEKLLAHFPQKDEDLTVDAFGLNFASALKDARAAIVGIKNEGEQNNANP